MIRAAALFGMTLLMFDTPVFAQSAGQIERLDACFQQSRLADSICEGQTDTDLRLDCFKKTRAVEFECLSHIAPAGPTTAATPPSREAAPAPPSASSNATSNKPPERTGSIEQTSPDTQPNGSPPSEN